MMSHGGNSDRKRTHLIGAGILVAMTAALLLGVVWPQMHQRAESVRLTEQLDGTRQALAGETTRLRSIHGQLQTIRKQLDGNDIELASADQLNGRIARITELGRSGGLNISQMKPGAWQKHEYYDTLPIRLDGLGQYDEIRSFLRIIHTDFPDINVRGLDIKSDGVPSGGEVRFTINLVWFAQS